MAETEKKGHRPPPDPNSAKFKLGKIADEAYASAAAAKARGEMVGWCASNFPVEIPETLGLAVVYPENQAAGIAARGAGVTMCEEAEAEGYSNDICAYARISLAYAKLKQAPVEPNVPMPDFVLCCNNICNCMIKWYENLARELNIPMFIIDIPFNPDYEVSDAQIAYVRAQFWDVIHGLEKLTGKKRILKALSNHMKDEIDAVLFARAYHQILLEESARESLPHDITDKGMWLAGLTVDMPESKVRKQRRYYEAYWEAAEF